MCHFNKCSTPKESNIDVGSWQLPGAVLGAWAVPPGTYCQIPLYHLVKRPRCALVALNILHWWLQYDARKSFICCACALNSRPCLKCQHATMSGSPCIARRTESSALNVVEQRISGLGCSGLAHVHSSHVSFDCSGLAPSHVSSLVCFCFGTEQPQPQNSV